MNYQQGIEDGKKSQKPIWIISGLISILGLIPIILSYLDFFKWGIFKIYSNSPKTKNINPISLKELVNQESYQDGLKKGKLKVRLKYWLIGFGVFVVTTSINPDINPLKMLGLKKQSEKNETNSNKTNSITGVYHIEGSNGYEYTTELKENGELVDKTYKYGVLKDSVRGFWEIENIEVNFVKETKRIKILIFNGRYYLEITEDNCLFGSSRETNNMISSKKPNLYPSNPDFLRSMDLYSPLYLGMSEFLCKDEKLSNQ